MDFFGNQDRARKRTRLLVVFFLIAVVVVVASIDLVAFLVWKGTHPKASDGDLMQLLLWLSGITIALVAFGSLYKSSALSKGGGAGIAHSLGGRLVRPGQGSPADRRLVNVVEEMALASSLPVPQIFVLDKETSINAFAAGLTHGDAVVAVTQGTLDQLSRDELQGVIAHEFSHILNGDMRLNLRLIGLVHGILVLAITGRVILSSLRHVRLRSSGRSGKGGGGVIAVVVLAGATLFVLGGIGWLAGRLIKAAVNRQREYLADSSAVQFTRNPKGLSGALQKLMGRGTTIRHARAGEMSHLFFGNALRSSMMATHPPLKDRIDRIDPGWRDRRTEGESQEGEIPTPGKPRPTTSPAFAEGGLMAAAPAGSVMAAAVPGLIGRLEATTPERGDAARHAVPEDVRVACADPFSARAAVLAAIADPTTEATEVALAAVRTAGGGILADETRRLHPAISALGRDAALSVVLMALPAMRELSPAQRDDFLRTLDALIKSDGVVTVSEQALGELAALHLGARPAPKGSSRDGKLRQEALDVLAFLARSSGTAESDFRAGARELGVADSVPMPATSDWAEFRMALDECRRAKPAMRRHIVAAAAWTVSADGVLAPVEAALLRLVVDALECPMPLLTVG